MISALLVCIAAICNAIMDVISHHYPRSIFSTRNPKWWNPRISWMNKYVDWQGGNRSRNNTPIAFTDAWHFFKSSMIVCLIGAIVVFPISTPLLFDSYILSYSIWFVTLGLLWNIVFLLFYQNIFRK